MKRSAIVFLFIAGLLAVPGFCKSKKKTKLFDCPKAVSEAVSFYNAGKYTRVVTSLSNAKLQCGGSPIMDSILYYLGMAELMEKSYIEARSSFELLAQDFPESPFNQEARFRIGYAVYMQSHPSAKDQTETREAIGLFRDFLDAYPEGAASDSARKYLGLCMEKLAEKDFNAANFYVKIEEFESAVVSFKTFINDHPESKLVDEARIISAELLIKLDRKAESREILDAVIQNSNDKETVIRANDLLLKAQ